MISSVMNIQNCPSLLIKDPIQQQGLSVGVRNLSHYQEDCQQFQMENNRLKHSSQRPLGKIHHLQVTRQKAVQTPKLRSRLQQLHQMGGGPTGPVYRPQVRLQTIHPLGGEAVQLNCLPQQQTTKVTEGLFSPRLLQRSRHGGQVVLKRVKAVVVDSNLYEDSQVTILPQ